MRRGMGPIIRATLLEAVRRREMGVVLILMGAMLALLLAARVVGLERPAAGTLLLNLGLTLTVMAAHLVTLLVAARQLPQEMEQRTLYPLLARPIARHVMVGAKWAAAAVVGTGFFYLFVLPVWWLVPRLECYDSRTLVQLLVLQPPALMLTAAIAILTSVYLPRALAVTVALLVVFGTDYIVRWATRWPVLVWIPNPMRLNLVLRYTDGIGPLSSVEFAALATWTLLWTAALLGQAMLRFERRPL